MKILPCIVAAVMLTSMPCHSEEKAGEVRALVLDALSGKPQAGVKITSTCVRLDHPMPEIKTATDVDGVARISLACPDGYELKVWVSPPMPKESCGIGNLSLPNIIATGVVTKPDEGGSIWCPAKASRKVIPHPGEVVFFVKKPTWWQAHVAG